jgi:hypothetical protein
MPPPVTDKDADIRPSMEGFGPTELGGLAAPLPHDPGRDVFGYMQDMFLNTVAGGVGVVRDIAGVKEAIQTSPPAVKQARGDMDALADLESYIRSGRTETAKVRDENPELRPGMLSADYVGQTVSGILPYAPIAAAGPWGVPIMGATAFGHARSDIRETIRQASLDQLKQSPKYRELVASGLSDEEAREKLYEATADPTSLEFLKSAAPEVIGNMIGGGAFHALSKGFMRKTTERITDSVLANTVKGIDQGTGVANFAGRRAIGAGQGAALGVGMGGGTAYTTQALEVDAGLRKEMDYGEVAEEAGKQALTFGALGAVSRRRKEVPPVGLDVESVARMQEQNYGGPGGRAIGPPRTMEIEPGRPMEHGDLGTSELGPEGPSRPPVTGGRPMEPAELGMSELGGMAAPGPLPGAHTGPLHAAPPVAPGAPGAPGVAPRTTPGPTPTSAGAGAAAGRRRAAGRPMHETDIWPTEYGQEQAPRAPVTGGRAMEHGDIGVSEMGPEAKGKLARTPRVQMRAEDLYGEYGQEQAPFAARPARTPESWRPYEAGERDMTRGDIGIKGGEEFVEAAPAKSIFNVPTLPTERAKPVTVEPKREPTAGEKYVEALKQRHKQAAAAKMEVGKPGRPVGAEHGVEAKPRYPLDWRDKKAIETQLVNVSPTTRGQWADRLRRAHEAGRDVTLNDIPEIGRRMFGSNLERIENLLRHNPEETIASIQGKQVERVPGGDRLSKKSVDALTGLMEKTKGADHKLWGERIDKLATALKGRVPWNRLVDEMREAMDKHDIRKEVVDAIVENPHHAADILRGREYQEPPREYRRKGETTRAGRVEVKEEPAEGEVTVEGKEAGKGQGEASKEAARQVDTREGTWDGPDGEKDVRVFNEPPEVGPDGRLHQRVLYNGQEGMVPVDELRRDDRAPHQRAADALEAVSDVLPAPRAPEHKVERPKLSAKFTTKLADLQDRVKKYWSRNVKAAAHPGERVIYKGREGLTYEEIEREANRKGSNVAGEWVGFKPMTEWQRGQRDAAQAARDSERAKVEEAAAKTRLRHQLAEDFKNIVGFHGRVSRALKLAFNRIPAIREMSATDRKRAAARGRERARKEGRTKFDYEDREALARDVMMDQHSGLSVLDDFWDVDAETGKGRRTIGDVLDNMIGVTGEFRLREKTQGEQKKGSVLPLDTASRETIERIAAKIVAVIDAKRSMAADLFAKAEAARPGTQISWAVPMNRGGRGGWYDRLGETRSMGRTMNDHLIAKNHSKLKEDILDFYIREKMLEKGRIAEWEKEDRHQKNIAYDATKSELSKVMAQLDRMADVDNAIARAERERERAGGSDAKDALAIADKQRAELEYRELLRQANTAFDPKLTVSENAKRVAAARDALKKRTADSGPKELKVNYVRFLEDAGVRFDPNKSVPEIFEGFRAEQDSLRKRAAVLRETLSQIEGATMQGSKAMMEARPEKGGQFGGQIHISDSGTSATLVGTARWKGWGFPRIEARIDELWRQRDLPEWQRELKLDFIRDEIIGKPLDEHLQAKREADRRAALEKEVLAEREPAKVLEENADKIVRNSEKVDAIRDAVESTPKDPADWVGRYQELSDRLSDALGVDRKRGTKNNLQQLIWDAEREVDRITTEQKDLYEKNVPGSLDNDFSIKQVLDGGVDLRTPGVMPRGSYVSKVSNFLMPGHDRSIMDGSEGSLLKHFYGMVRKLVGDHDVVALTNEQYARAAELRDVDPADTPAFYDRRTQRIFTTHETLAGPDRARIMGHEFGHPLTELAIEKFPAIGNRIDRIRQILARERHDLELRRARMARFGGEAEGHPLLDFDPQALTNVHEFITEFFNDGGKLEAALHGIRHDRLSGVERADTAVPENRRTLLQSLLSAMKKGLRDLFFTANKKQLLNDMTLNSLDLFQSLEALVERKGPMRATPGEGILPFSREQVVEHAGKLAVDVKRRWDTLSGTSLGLGMHDLDEMSRRAEPGMQAVTREIKLVLDKTFHTARKLLHDIGTERLARKLADHKRLSQQSYDRVQDYIHKENYGGMSGADPLHEGRNAWVSRDSVEHTQHRRRHGELAADWAKLTPKERELRNELLEFYEKRHNDMLNTSLGHLINLRRMVPGNDKAQTEALMKYIMKRDLSAADKAELEKIPGYASEIDETTKTPQHLKFRQQVRELRAVPQFRKLPGVFYAMMRRGQHVVEGVYKLAKHAEPNGGVERGRGEWEFETAEKRAKFIQDMDNDPVLRDLRLIDTEDVVYKKDPATGGPLMEDGAPVFETEPSTRQTRQQGEPGEVGYRGTVTTAERRKGVRETEGRDDVVNRYRVTYNPLLLEFYEKQREAYERHAQLKAGHSRDDFDLSHVQPQRDRDGTFLDSITADRHMQKLMGSIENGDAWGDLDTRTRASIKRDLAEGAARHLMSTSARASYLPRRYALGANNDMLRNFTQYAQNTSYTLAELQHRAETSRAYKAMEDYVDQNDSAASPNDPQGKYGYLRHEIRNKLRNVGLQDHSEFTSPWWTKAANRVMQLSYMDKLMSPMHWALNAMEVGMMTSPLLAGRHGIKAYGVILNAYNTVGGLSMLKEGFSNAPKAFMRKELPENLARLRDNIKNEKDAAQLSKLIDWLEERNLLDKDAGMEIGRIGETGDRIWSAADRVDNATRQINQQIENMNRAVTGISAYRLGIMDGMTHEQAMAHAEKTVHDVAGNYAHYNTPELFKHPYLRFALQFKRYAQRITANYIRMWSNMMNKELSADERRVARNQMMVTLGTQMFMAGMLGWPTELIKAPINIANALHIIDFNAEDAEHYFRSGMSRVMGDDLAQIVTRGVPRYFGLGIGSRVAHDSLWTFGSLGRKPDDWWAAFGHFIGGAPGGYMVDAVQGTGKLVDAFGDMAHGRNTSAQANFTDGIAQIIPSKVMADVLTSAQRFGQWPTGRKDSGYKPSGLEALGEAFGLRSGRSQEIAEERGQVRRDLTRHDTQRDALYAQFAKASTNAEKMAIWRDIQTNWNPKYPPEMQITFDALHRAQVRHDNKGDADPRLLGLTLSRRQQSLLPNYNMYKTQ